jgi:hypothetical protein
MQHNDSSPGKQNSHLHVFYLCKFRKKLTRLFYLTDRIYTNHIPDCVTKFSINKPVYYVLITEKRFAEKPLPTPRYNYFYMLKSTYIACVQTKE